MLNDVDAADVQVVFAAVKVYDVPAVAPVMVPPAPNVNPDGLETYVTVASKLLTVEVPAAEQVAAVVVIVGTAGVANCAAFVNDADAAEVQVVFAAVKVYDVPAVAPEMAPPAPTVNPAGVET